MKVIIEKESSGDQIEEFQTSGRHNIPRKDELILVHNTHVMRVKEVTWLPDKEHWHESDVILTV